MTSEDRDLAKAWRLVDSGLVGAARSAALDEAILEAHVQGKVPGTLHFYLRSEPTVSVGYFQKLSETVDMAECERRGVRIVRRKSGGSSIYTDSGQLIYGLVVGEKELPADPKDCFRLICSAIARAISSFGLQAAYRPPNDVDVQGKKVSGNAQLRRRTSVLQHGTVIVATDLVTMDAVLRPAERGKRPSDRVATITSLLGHRPTIYDVQARVAGEIAVAFDARFAESPLSAFERDEVARLVAERYGKKEWNERI